MGTAAEARMPRIATVTMSSTSVRPASRLRLACSRLFKINCIVSPLDRRSLDVHDRLRAHRWYRLLLAVAHNRPHNGNRRVAWGFRLEGEDAQRPRACDAFGSGRTRSGDGGVAFSVIAMRQGYGLSVFAQNVRILRIV